MHYTEACPFAKHVCKECKQIGHIDGYCGFARPSGKPKPSSVKEVSSDQTSARRRKKFVGILINGKPIKLLENLGIISFVEHSDWAAPIVAERKANGTIRIYGDHSTGLNNALQPNDYPLPVPDDIFASLAGMRLFSIIDLSNA